MADRKEEKKHWEDEWGSVTDQIFGNFLESLGSNLRTSFKDKEGS